MVYDPIVKELKTDAWNVNRMLMKRYYMIERARDARRVGILVGTLGVSDYLSVIRRLSQLIKTAGKKCYRFVMGKLNVAKLANFAEIDVYVLVACPENSLIDSSEMLCPIVTPYEMELACQTDRQWTGDYQVDFRQLLPGGSSHYESTSVTESKDQRSGSDHVTTDVSLITGRVRQIGVDEEQRTTKNNASLIQQDNRLIEHDSAGEFLASRSWQGLEAKLGETEVEKAVLGSHGLAAGYSHEPMNLKHESKKIVRHE